MMKQPVNIWFKQNSSIRLLSIFVLFSIFIILLNLPNTATTYAQDGNTATPTVTTDPSGTIAESVLNKVDVHFPDITAEVVVSDIEIDHDWAFGIVVIKATNIDESPTLFLFIAHKEETGWLIALEMEDNFNAYLNQIPDSLISIEVKQFMENEAEINAAGNEVAQLSLPWSAGQSWKLTGGPHKNSINSTVWSALDFQGPNRSGVARAARSGVVWRSSTCPNFIRIDHSNGWQTGYYHLSNEKVSKGQTVSRGQALGDISTKSGCGGSATGPHVHFSLRKNGVEQKIDGHDIGGWTVHNGTAQYNGYMVRVSDGKRINQWGTIYNDGSIGSGADTSSPTTRVTSIPSGWIQTDNVTIQWEGSDDQTSKANLVYSYKLDSASWSSWTGNTSKTYNNLAEGSHTFWVKAKDEAGNVDASPAERSFKVDTTKPNAPTINPGCTASDNQWQNTCRDPSFSWSATDPNGSDGSGVDKYAYAWNTSANGNPSNWGSVTSHNPGPIANSDGVEQHYLHVKAKDLAGNTSSVSTFGLWYDGSAPTTALAINGGASTANQVTVHLNLESNDTGSGVSQVRISNNSIQWTSWQPYADTISWAIPALDLHTHTVYVQVRDQAGNTSTVVSDDIYLDLYPIMPHSENYRLCANVIDIGGSVDADSTSFKLTSAIGQPLSTGTSDLTSTNFAGRSGFLSSTTGCLPIEHTVTNDFTLTNWVIASGGNLHSSATYQLQETIGQPVASGATTMSSASFQLSSGFWGSTNPFAGDCALLNFDPQSGSLPLHQTFTVDILASNVVDLYGAQLEISFDPTKLQVVDDDAGLAGVQISPGTCPKPDNVVQNTVDSTAGIISYSAHSLSPSPPCNEGGTVASITFEGVGGGNSSLGFYTTLVSDTTGDSICAHTTDGRLEIVTSGACIFTGTIDLQSRSDDSGASFTAGAYATTTDASGYYELTVPEDTYDVTAEMDLYLDGERTGEVCLAGEEIQLPGVTLLGGDTNDDCVINILDLSFIGSRFMTSAGDTNYDPMADINDDGTVNILDLSVTGGNFMETCPVNWP